MRWSHGSVADLLTGRNNSMGLLRPCLSIAVLVAHARILGFDRAEFGHSFTHGQTDLGKWAVYGFFILSGILVTRSGARLPLGRFLWHRALRLLPGLWVCLFLTAFLAAPLVYWRVHGTLDGFLGHSHGPLEYLRSNWRVALHQLDVSDAMADAVQAGLAHDGGINGALWSLYSEVFCYLGIAVLAVTGVLTRARRVVLVGALVLGWLVIRQAGSGRFWAGPQDSSYPQYFFIPLFGSLNPGWIIYLGFAFALGAVIEMYKERIAVSDALGIMSLLVLLAGARYGYLFVVGLPAFAYLLVWLAVRLPAPFRRIGARHDYSYGIYIYGFVCQQVLLVYGFARWGLIPYLAACLALTTVLAVLSWHCVERPAMRLKDVWKPGPTPTQTKPADQPGPTTPPGSWARQQHPPSDSSLATDPDTVSARQSQV
ncbi:acyltransferase [Streptomyces sp. ISL-43]|uniref:acyltransferase family protein n=1 Tax=Streptomyces sp. ISL-43 TaxID=2819183 RepID=UPI001BE8ABE9|nr:acyltransferase [Streptomyces sp. ISL-43]MBT2447817.1 acyltransferase [Streptomyces sp. ISL-43]